MGHLAALPVSLWSGTGARRLIWWTGTGAYAGLTYFTLLTGDGPWKIQRQIFPAEPPTP